MQYFIFAVDILAAYVHGLTFLLVLLFAFSVLCACPYIVRRVVDCLHV